LIAEHDATDRCIHELFTAQAARTPDAEAVAFGGASLSYRELARRADLLARHLRRLGAGPDTLVGLAVERSIDMIVALLGVLQAGGAYVPLDPSHPRERLAFLWEDIRAGNRERPSILLTWRGLADLLPLSPEGTVYLDEPLEDLPDAQGGGPGPVTPVASVTPDNAAYVIYTSGSTGWPKGVVVPHRGVSHVAGEAARLLAVGPGSRFLQISSLGFDASVLEIFTSLVTGGCVVLTPRETLLSGEALGRVLREERITTLVLPPSLLDTVEAGAERELPHLSAILVGGEACSAVTAARWSAGRRMVNAYAPTEATVFATASFCDGQGVPTLGGPIPRMSVRLLDQDGVAVEGPGDGEIHLGGVGVVRGYLNRPDLTAERFVPDPFAAVPGGRLYRSGDLARRLPDGDLLFLGRVDFQVKIRGNRIELGEIEAVLGQHPGVQTAVAVAREEGGTKRLVAYVVRRDPALTVSALRAYLTERLPEYMVPEAFVFIATMPMTPTGKVDRRALPAPGRSRPEMDAVYTPPRDEREAALARIWGDLLRIDSVGVDDDLFELGGHSLLASQIVTRVHQELGVDLGLTEVFEQPTVARLAERLRDLATESSPMDDPLPPLGRAPRDQPIPLSFPQERVWFLSQLAPGNCAYNFQVTVRFRGPLEPAVLLRSLAEIVRRHEVLRTTFPAADGRPVQVIHADWPAGTLEVPEVDLSGLPEGERGLEAERLVHAEIRRPFDIERLPLMRWRLIKLDAADHLFLHVEHHFVHDGWSLAVFLRELVELYPAFAAGRPSPLPELPVQYADFSVWQRRWLEDGALAGQLAWWKEQLAGSPPVLELPADRPRPRAHSFRGGALRADLPAPLYGRTRAFGRREGGTLFMTALAAFYSLLHRYTGQTDMLLGSGIANRRLREVEELIGMVVNTIVLRARVDGGLTFRELLVRVRRATLEAHAHQDMPFEKLVEELRPDRELSRNPLFQVLFSFHDAPVPDLEFAGLSGDLLERHNGSAKSDLNVVAKPRAEQRVGLASAAEDAMTFIWEYSGDLFDAATIDRMWAHYQTLLAEVIADPGLRLSEVPLLTGAERGQLTVWSRSVPAPPSVDHRPAHLLIAGQAERRPDALAVAGDGARWTYGELVRGARALASRLRALGVGPETVVAVCAERSPETVLAALAVLKAGGAYLPLDPAYPAERLRFLLEDSGAAAVLVRPDLRGALPGLDATVPVLDIGLVEGEGGAVADPDDPDRLAYVIYTSGSTGRPKGVEIPHRGLSNLIAWHRGACEVTPEDRTTLLAGPAFDASVWEIWPTLAAGASLHIPDAATRSDPARLLTWLAAEGITLAFLPTPLAEALLEEAGRELPPGLKLRALLTGGDRLRRAPAPGLPFRLVNHYGPTESAVVTTAAPVPAGSISSRHGRTVSGAPPIGRPIDGISVHLLSPALRRAPQGVPGELCVGGAGLARGYRGQPALTADRFVPDPQGGDPGSRLYRTGDLARWLPDGQLEFLGRLDHQVKVRGVRIEPGEIETVLREHPGVREAVVVARGEGEERRLVAYVAPESAGDLGVWLAERLPASMVPALFVPLAALPLTPNGKVDLRALPEPDWGGGDRGSAAPRTPLEELLAGIWSTVLGVSAVGLHDNFFKLGGHSLIATRVLSRVRDAVGAEVPLATLFEAPTIASLARAVEEILGGPGGTEAGGTIPRRPEGEPAPLSFAQERLWFLDQLTPGVAAYNIARAFSLRGRLDAAALERAASGILGRHEALRTTFGVHGAGPVQVVSPGAEAAVPRVDLSALPGPLGAREADRLLREEARRPFDLERGPLLRLTLLRLGPEDHRLALTLHHIAADGWSMDLFFRELAALYGETAAGVPAALPALPVQYPDVALWQRERLQGERLESLLAHWKRELAGAPALLELPTDRPRPPAQSFRGAQVEQELPAELAARLRASARGSAATPFMVLLATLAALFDRSTGRQDVVLGSPVAGRNRSEVEGLIGLFVNTLVLRLSWDGDPGFGELLDRARRATLAAHAHQDLPFEKLVAELAPERNLGHTPLFQAMLTHQSRAADALEMPGLAVAPLPIVRGESRFDLEVGVIDGGAGEGLRLLWRYDRDLFDTATVERMAGHFSRLVDGLLADPGRRLSTLPLLSPGEEEHLLLWAGPPVSLPAESGPETLHGLFSAQALRTPEAVAVFAGSTELTYRDLDRRSERIARRLRRAGVGPEVVVGLLMERSPDLIAGLLGILRAGGAYLPLEPAYPDARIASLLEDSGAGLILADSPLRARAASLGSTSVLTPEDGEDGPGIAGAGSGPDHLAYVIYTSGSTGRPKGVAIEHRSAVALLRWAAGEFPSEDLAGVLASTSVCFDLSVFEVFAPLTRGGALVLAENALALLALPAAGRVTLLNTVPSAMAELLELGAVPPSVRTVNLAGEPLPPRLVDQIYARTDARRVLDLYGPSEDTTYSTCALREAGGPATIGRPIAGTRAILLDRWGNRVPPGVPGEICLGGQGLARGYLLDPVRTAERFVPDPFAPSPGERLYRTGDLARWRPDGRLELLGRIDHQVKVRGFRIELGEIERHLAHHPGVRESAVLAWGEGGARALVAYVAPSSPEALDGGGDGLRTFLAERLPVWMVPSAFAVLAALPRMASGKVDRGALPAPEASRPDLETSYTAPETAEEKWLAEVWAEVLGIERVGVHDDFFHLGGHSLLAARVIARLRRHLQVDLPLRSLFQGPTIAGLLSAVQQARADGGGAAVPRIAPVSRAAHRRVRPAEGNPR
jgi:amino acid adenylation domain-containing protein